MTFCSWSRNLPYYFVIIVVYRWGLRLYYCNVERDCPQVHDDELAGGWATFHDSVHGVPLNMKSNSMLVFTHFSTIENLVSFLCVVSSMFFHLISRTSHFKESKDVPSVPFHCVYEFL